MGWYLVKHRDNFTIGFEPRCSAAVQLTRPELKPTNSNYAIGAVI
jgi:hypothetical protein